MKSIKKWNIGTYTLNLCKEFGKEAGSDFGKREADLPSTDPVLKSTTIKVVAVQVLNHTTEYQMILKFVNIWQFRCN